MRIIKSYIIALICFGCFGIKHTQAQLTEFGLGFSPVLYSGTEFSTFDNGSGYEQLSSSSVENTPMITGHMMLGMYFHLLHLSEDFSLGAHYQITTFVGSMDGGYFDAKMIGVDLPVFAELRFGNLATEGSNSDVGGSLGAGALYTANTFLIDDEAVGFRTFMPCMSTSLSVRNVGIQLVLHPGRYQIMYGSNTGCIPRAEFFRYHITYYWYLGEL